MRKIKTLWLCTLMVSGLLTEVFAQTISIGVGNWNNTSTWSTGTIPDQATDVIIRHTVSIPSGYDAVARDVTVDNSESRDVRLKLVGSSARSLHVYGNLTLTATTAYECYMEISYEPNSVLVDGNVYMTKNLIGSVDFGPRLRLNAGHMTINGDLEVSIGNGDGSNSVILMNGDAAHGGFAPTLDILGTFRYSTSSNNSSVGLNLHDETVVTCEFADFDLDGDEGSNRDFNVYLFDEAQFIINQDASISRSGGNQFYIRIGQTGDNALFSIGGDLTLDHLGGEDVSGDELEVEINGTGTFYIGGDLTANSDSERALSIIANENAAVTFDGDVSLTGTADNISLEFNDNSSVDFSGEINMDFPGGTDFSDIIVFNDAADASFDNATSTTIIPAGLNFTNLTVDTEFGMELSSDITISGQLVLLKGKLDAQGNTIHLASTASTSITRNDSEVTYPSYIYNGKIRRQMLLSDGGSYIFPVGHELTGYSPVILSGLQGSDAEFEVEYIRGNPAVQGWGTDASNLSGDLKQISILEAWDIHKVTTDLGNAIGAVVTLTLNDQSSETGDFADLDPVSSLRVAHWLSATSKWESLSASSEYNAGNRTISSSGVQYSFSGFSVASEDEDSGLPVELIRFTAEENESGNGILIEWETASELNNSHFILEKSTTSENFQKLEEIEGNGTTNTPVGYSYLDKKNDSRFAYYRLKQYDYDGTFSFSEVISIVNKSNQSSLVSLYPNPVSTELKIYLNQKNPLAQISIVSDEAKEVFTSSEWKVGENSLDLRQLEAGVYFLIYWDPEGFQSFKFIKD
ncbi:MAG: T9SS type A sorting domain-containing protein [Reichenbachiella sp.]|uniref:T9SS type A sorting domain-containing protein n=1 Tax=Reichenbachiella sp. TaxID=2184521 RepID=UPI003263719E